MKTIGLDNFLDYFYDLFLLVVCMESFFEI